jgi:PAS domain-containing protein
MAQLEHNVDDVEQQWSRLGRKRIVDRIAVSTVAFSFVAISVAWLFQSLSFPIRGVARAVLMYVPFYLVCASLAERIRHPRRLLAASIALHVSLIAFLAVLWHLVGGVQNPAFLAAFVVPTIGVAVLYGTRWAIPTAAGAVASAFGVGFVESAELRWYLIGLGLPLSGLAARMPIISSPEVFSGLSGTAASQFVLLEVFAMVMVGGVALCGSFAEAFQSFLERVMSTRALQRHSEGLLRTGFRDALDPTVLVDPETGQLLLASASFTRQMLLHGEDISKRTIFDVIGFGEPAKARVLMRTGGVWRLCSYGVGPESRVAEVTFAQVRYRGQHCVTLTLRDLTEISYLKAALESLDEPHLIVGRDDRLCYANRAAEQLFGQIYFGMHAGEALNEHGLPTGWWDPSTRITQNLKITAKDGVYRADCLIGGETAGILNLVRLKRETNGHAPPPS